MKQPLRLRLLEDITVSLCVREWIETSNCCACAAVSFVSLCVREWIETFPCIDENGVSDVSLCVREWIETWAAKVKVTLKECLPLREGVD